MPAQNQSSPSSPNAERLTDRAYSAVLDRIFDGSLPAGAAVPERRLSEDIGLSRSRVREALSRLEGEGVLTRDRANALCVRDVTLNEALRALQLIQTIEPALTATITDAEARARIVQIAAAIEAGSLYGSAVETGILAAEMALHRIIVEQSENSFALPIAQLLWRAVGIYRTTTGHRARAGEIASALTLCRAVLGAEGISPEAASNAHLADLRAALLDAV